MLRCGEIVPKLQRTPELGRALGVQNSERSLSPSYGKTAGWGRPDQREQFSASSVGSGPSERSVGAGRSGPPRIL